MVVVVWVYGIMGLSGYQLNSQTVTIGALTLGLGVDYAVHFTTRLEEEVEHAPNADPADWTTKSAATTGRAMFGAALTTAGGFSVLNFSSLVPLQLFGQVFVVAIVLVACPLHSIPKARCEEVCRRIQGTSLGQLTN